MWKPTCSSFFKSWRFLDQSTPFSGQSYGKNRTVLRENASMFPVGDYTGSRSMFVLVFPTIVKASTALKTSFSINSDGTFQDPGGNNSCAAPRNQDPCITELGNNSAWFPPVWHLRGYQQVHPLKTTGPRQLVSHRWVCPQAGGHFPVEGCAVEVLSPSNVGNLVPFLHPEDESLVSCVVGWRWLGINFSPLTLIPAGSILYSLVAGTQLFVRP